MVFLSLSLKRFLSILISPKSLKRSYVIQKRKISLDQF